MRKESIKQTQTMIGLVIVMVMLTVASNIAEASSSTFDSNSEEWGVVSFQAPYYPNPNSTIKSYPSYINYQQNGGNPGGYISSSDPDGGWFFFSAPDAFLGNQSGAYNSTFTYDITHNGNIDYHTSDVWMFGGGEKLLWTSNPPLNPNSTWSHVSVTLAPSSQWQTDQGTSVSTSDFQNVLANLTGLYIRGEFSGGVAETTGLDNVQLANNPVPIPASIWLFGSALTGLVGVGRRKTH